MGGIDGSGGRSDRLGRSRSIGSRRSRSTRRSRSVRRSARRCLAGGGAGLIDAAGVSGTGMFGTDRFDNDRLGADRFGIAEVSGMPGSEGTVGISSVSSKSGRDIGIEFIDTEFLGPGPEPRGPVLIGGMFSGIEFMAGLRGSEGRCTGDIARMDGVDIGGVDIGMECMGGRCTGAIDRMDGVAIGIDGIAGAGRPGWAGRADAAIGMSRPVGIIGRC
jgi:hypothetical protein